MAGATDSPQRVFISYRREDSAAYAGRIYDAMVARFGESNVFMDVELAPGIDFVERITEVVSGCAALIVVIGPNWASAEDEDGVQRLSDPADFVRREVVAAVQRSDVTVIPALVGKARMPRATELPEELEPLSRRNALELSDGRWRYDIGRLTDTLDELLAGLTGFGMQQQAAAEPAPPPPPPVPDEPVFDRPPAARLLLEGVLIAAVVAYLGRWLVDPVPESSTTAGEIIAVAARRAGVWGLTGAALGLWLGLRTKRTDLVYTTLLGLLVGAIAGAIGGAIWAFPVYLPEAEASAAKEHNWEIVAVAVTGSLVGGLLGTLWRRPHLAVGILSGLLAGALVQIILTGAGVDGKELPEVGIALAIRAAAITGAVLITMLALEPRRAAAFTRNLG